MLDLVLYLIFSLASTKDRMDEYHQYAGVAQTIGVDVKFLSPDQVKEIWPLCHTT